LLQRFHFLGPKTGIRVTVAWFWLFVDWLVNYAFGLWGELCVILNNIFCALFHLCQLLLSRQILIHIFELLEWLGLLLGSRLFLRLYRLIVFNLLGFFVLLYLVYILNIHHILADLSRSDIVVVLWAQFSFEDFGLVIGKCQFHHI
jgi:amino acid permease